MIELNEIYNEDCLERLYMATPQKDYAIVTQSIGRIARTAAILSRNDYGEMKVGVGECNI